MSDSAIEVRSVSKSFRIPSVRRDTVRENVLALFQRPPVEELVVLDDVSFTVGRGETFGIMGRNGCGKSTLLKILSGIYQADRGQVRRGGTVTPILDLGIGWNPELDARDNAFLIGGAMGMSLRDIGAALPQILVFAELERFASLPLKHYSSGMASRLAYAVAFAAVKEILILDEIFAVGDVGFRARCEARYRELHAAGHTVVLVSHLPYYISQFCSRAILLDAGRIALQGSGAEVADRYLSEAGRRPEPGPEVLP